MGTGWAFALLLPSCADQAASATTLTWLPEVGLAQGRHVAAGEGLRARCEGGCGWVPGLPGPRAVVPAAPLAARAWGEGGCARMWGAADRCPGERGWQPRGLWWRAAGCALEGQLRGVQSAVPADAGRWVARVRCCGNVVGVKLRVVWLFPAVRGL